jgi:hypothetical protein
MSTHPYISGTGNVSQMIMQLRKSFPGTVTADTVKKLGLAPNNESSVINTLQFVGLLDTEGKKTKIAGDVFSKHKNEDFAKGFEALVKGAYVSLFELHADHTWTLSDEDLITFFRQTDQTGEVIGKRQANTFKVLAALAGHGEPPTVKPAKSKATKSVTLKVKKADTQLQTPDATKADGRKPTGEKDFGLSVRIEINLPPGGTKETYDNIFKSIRENLLNG